MFFFEKDGFGSGKLKKIENILVERKQECFAWAIRLKKAEKKTKAQKKKKKRKQARQPLPLSLINA